MDAKSLERRKSQLETYFVEHQIEGRLNNMLNDMALARPGQPYRWLARKMRGEEGRPMAARTTMPQMDAATAAAALGAGMEKAWTYATCFASPGSGTAAAAAPAATGGKGAPKKSAATTGGLELSIEALGSGVLLAIREQK